MGFFDYASIRRSVTSFEQQLQKMQNEATELRRQLVQITSAPASKDDLKQMLSAWVSSHAEKYRLSLRETLLKFMRNPRNVTPRNFVRRAANRSGPDDLPGARKTTCANSR